MNSLFTISIVSWAGMWFAFHLGHPVGYVIALIGLAAAVAIALEAPSSQTEAKASEAAAAARNGTPQSVAGSEHQKDAIVSAAEQWRAAERQQSTEIRNAA
jgi:hypothetical protein